MKREFHLNKDSSRTDIEISYDSETKRALIRVPGGAEEFKIQRGNSTMEILLFKKPRSDVTTWALPIHIGYASWIIVEGTPQGSSNYWTKRGDFKASGFGYFGSSVSIAGALAVSSGATVNSLQVAQSVTIASAFTLTDLGGLVSVGATDGSSYVTLRVPSGS